MVLVDKGLLVEGMHIDLGSGFYAVVIFLFD